MKKKNVKKIPYVPMLIITAVVGLIYAVVTNLFIDKLLNAVWKPLVVALYFTVFALLISAVIFLVAEMIGSREKMKDFFKVFGVFTAALFVSSMIFEIIYEIGLKQEDLEPKAYIIVIDDSGSMESNDPQKKRAQAIGDIVSDKPDDFEYAVYIFSGSSQKIRDMAPKSKGVGAVPLNSSGSTYIGATLRGILNDIESGTLRVKENTRVILLSDGAASDIGFLDFRFNDTLEEFSDAGIVISTVGLGNAIDVNLMEKIAKKTGGVYIHADEAGQLSSAMTQASVHSANRSLIGSRGYCRTDVLHAIMRVVFLILIGAAVNLIKINAGGEFKTMQIIIASVATVAAALFTEIGLEVIGFGEGFTRMILCVLLALFMVNKIIRIRSKRTFAFDDGEFGTGDEYGISGYSSLDKNFGMSDDDVQSLGTMYSRRKK